MIAPLGVLVTVAGCGPASVKLGGDSASAMTEGDADTDTDTDTDADGDSDTDTDTDAGAPACTVTHPVDGSSYPYDTEVSFIASAADLEDGDLADAAVVWTTEAGDVFGTGTSFTSALPGSGTLVLTCTATDSEGNMGSGSVTVISLSPLAEIWHPGEGETRHADDAVPFRGVARDREDGALSGRSLSWSSDRDGALGTGESFDARLSVGGHVITLTASDADGNQGSASISLTMQ